MDQLAERVMADYLAARPTRRSSRAIVKALSVKHRLSEASARGRLVKAGVYLAMPRDKSHVAPGDCDALLAFFAKDDGSSALIKEAAEEFGYHQDTILNFRMTHDLPVLSVREVSFRQSKRRAFEKRKEEAPEPPRISNMATPESEPAYSGGVAEPMTEMGATARDADFFSHPFWPVHVTALIVLSGVVAVAIKSIFGV